MTDLLDLQAFVAVCEAGGYRAAAERLRLAQPSLTRRIHRLEQQLGVRLLERGPRGIVLTDQGATFLKGARRILTILEELKATTTGRWLDVLHLGCSATVAGSILARFLATWIPQHPDVQVIMIEGATHELKAKLEDRECELAVIAGPIPKMFGHHLLRVVRVQALIPPHHPLAASRDPFPVTELDGENIMVNGPGFLSTELPLMACRSAGVQPRIVYECSVGQTLAALAESGMGIAIMGDSIDLRGFDLPRRYVTDANGNLLTFELHIAWLKERKLPPFAYELARELARTVDPSGAAGGGTPSS